MGAFKHFIKSMPPVKHSSDYWFYYEPEKIKKQCSCSLHNFLFWNFAVDYYNRTCNSSAWQNYGRRRPLWKYSFRNNIFYCWALFDGFDGKVARLTGSTSRFGVEFDSLADLVSFGVAPSILFYLWALRPYGRIGWLAACLFMTCGALRLARFNVQASTSERRYFRGLPTPAAAGLIATFIIFHQYIWGTSGNKPIIIALLAYLCACLMVSNIRYHSLKELELKKKKPFNILVAAFLIICIVVAAPQVVLFILATLFMQADRGHAIQLASGLLSPEDELIRELIPEAAQKEKAFLAASQWPARTMLAVRSDVLPLPPVANDGPAQLEMIKNITHVVFDHNDPDNTGLTQNFRDITGATETLSRMPGGVIIKIREAANKPAHEPAPIAPAENDTPALPASK